MTRELGRYKSLLLEIFRTSVREEDGAIPFSQADLRRAATNLGMEIRNFPDVTYNLRSRAPLPQELIDEGYTSIEIRGRGQYAVVKSPDKIAVPPDVPVATWPTAGIPECITDLLRPDEQGVLSAMRYVGVVSDFLSCPCYHLQGHLRTTGRMGQQVEADEIYVAVEPTGGRTIVPIEAKGPRERLGLQQIKSTVDAVLTKIPGFPVLPMAAQLDTTGDLLLVSFDLEQDLTGEIVVLWPVRFQKYRFHPQLPQWPSRQASGEAQPPLSGFHP